jgi:ribosomal-protein-serine acetyltransferase
LELTPPPLDAPRLRLATNADVGEIHALVERSRATLAEWLPWAVEGGIEEVRAFRRQAELDRRAGTAIHTVIEVDGQIAGSIGAHHVDRANGACELGYWLGDGFAGRGLMTAAVRAYLDEAFGAWGLRRVAILAATENLRSRAIPERLGFTCEGVLREAEVVGDRVVDLAVYSLLRHEHRA